MKLSILLVCALLKYSDSVKRLQREVSELGSTKSTQIAALGRVANLGDLYDARTDNFLDTSIYTAEVPKNAVRITNDTHSHIDYVRTESLQEKLEKLGVSPSLSVSYLAGMVKVSGSGKYLNQDRKTYKSAKSSIVYSLRTVKENLQIFSKISADLIDKFVLENMDRLATHVVVGVEWGTNVVLSLEDTNTNSLNAREKQRELEAVLNGVVSSAFDPSDNSSHVEGTNNYSIDINADVIPKIVPGTMNESIAFMKNIPELIEKEYNGKGKKMSYVLMPLVTIQNFLKVGKNESVVVNDIDSELVDELMRISQEMRDSELQITNDYNGMKKWALMIPESDYQNVSSIKSRFTSFKNDFRKMFSDSVVKFRNGELDKTALQNVTATYETSSLKNVHELLNPYIPTERKITLMNLLKSLNALFVNNETGKDHILEESYHQEVRLISMDLTRNISSFYIRTIVTLLEEEIAKQYGAARYYIEDDPNSTVPNVKTYSHGNVTNTYPVVKTEYLILVVDVTVIVLDGSTFEQITTYDTGNIYRTSIAVVDDTFYIIDVYNGQISSTNVKNIIAQPKDGIIWDHVGSFPSEGEYMRSVAAVSGSIIYFVTPSAHFYKFDTALKKVTKYSVYVKSDHVGFASLIPADGGIYIFVRQTLHTFHGTLLFEVDLPHTRAFAGLFEFEGKICVVGGDSDRKDNHPVTCYDPKERNWSNVASTNADRQTLGVATTQSGTVIVGGYATKGMEEPVLLDSVELFNHTTKTWSFIKTPPAIRNGLYLALSFKFNYDWI